MPPAANVEQISMQPTKSPFVPVCLMAFGLLVAGVAPALGQAAAPQSTQRDYGWVAFATGATFGNETETAAAFTGEYGEDVTPHVQVHATISYFENLMPRETTDDLSALSASLTTTTGTTWNLRGRDRGVTMIGGGRYLLNPRGTMRPYLGGGAGIINLKRTIVDPRVGDLTASVLSEFGVGSLSITTQTLTRPLIEGGLGVGFFTGPVYVDVGYRYKRAFHLDETFDFSQAVVGIGYKF
jgi:opacity protein-like surface antigen